MAASSWGNLHLEIILLIAKRLSLADIVRIRAVCSWWAWVLGKPCNSRPPPLPPPTCQWFRPSSWLLLPNAAGADFCTFLPLMDHRHYKISSIPQISGRRFVGSSPDGWLVTLDLLLNPRLFNPFTAEELPLPPLRTLPNIKIPAYSKNDRFYYGKEGEIPDSIENFRDGFLRKIIITSALPQGGRIAVAVCTMDIFQIRLAFASVEDKRWARGPELPMGNFFEDVIYHEADNKFFAVTNRGTVLILACSKRLSWEVVSVVAGRIEDAYFDPRRRYIFFSSGDLLQVIRTLDYEEDAAVRGYEEDGEGRLQIISKAFRIFRFDPDCHCRQDPSLLHGNLPNCPYDSCWVPVSDLGDQSLFLGANHSSSLLASDELGLKRNRVYFTDDLHIFPWQKNSFSDVGVFDLESNTIEHFFPSNCQANWPPPIWFMPSLVLWD